MTSLEVVSHADTDQHDMAEKILALGNNGYNTDHLVQALADSVGTANHGLITDKNFIPVEDGYYHTTILDLSFGDIVGLSQRFDLVIMLDQPRAEWTHWKPLLSTYKIMVEIEKSGLTKTQFRHNQNIKSFENFSKLVNENPSFCIFPWINLVEENGYLHPCARGNKAIKKISEVINWQKDPDYGWIRQQMLAGNKLPEHCWTCYKYEEKGIESYRQFETKDWIAKLEINSIDDLEQIDRPYYYDIRLNNQCNIKCRGCTPVFSSQIEKEFKQFKIQHKDMELAKKWKYMSMDVVNIDKLDSRTRIYLTGGEPTIIAEVMEFMQRCIDAGKTDFDFALCTNGAVVSQKFLDLVNHFSNVTFSFSIDGYGAINDYWRSGSKWEKVIANAHMLKSHGHVISFNTVPGIYNVTNLHLLFEFFDREFPHAGVYMQLNNVDSQSAFNHPRPDLVVESMERCKKTSIYWSDGKSNRTCIDSLHDHYSKNPPCDLVKLREFFEYNDQLDRIRGTRLGDCIPELDACRALLR